MRYNTPLLISFIMLAVVHHFHMVTGSAGTDPVTAGDIMVGPHLYQEISY